MSDITIALSEMREHDHNISEYHGGNDHLSGIPGEVREETIYGLSEL